MKRIDNESYDYVVSQLTTKEGMELMQELDTFLYQNYTAEKVAALLTGSPDIINTLADQLTVAMSIGFMLGNKFTRDKK